MIEYQTITSEDMEQVGKKIAQTLTGGDIVLLYGELGAGKTTLTKGIAKELGVKDAITSPSFTLMNIYPTKHSEIKNLVHVDTYRLKESQDLLDIGITDYLNEKDTLCVIEWPEKLEDLLKNVPPLGGIPLMSGKKVKKISIEHTDGNGRKIKIT